MKFALTHFRRMRLFLCFIFIFFTKYFMTYGHYCRHVVIRGKYNYLYAPADSPWVNHLPDHEISFTRSRTGKSHLYTNWLLANGVGSQIRQRTTGYSCFHNHRCYRKKICTYSLQIQDIFTWGCFQSNSGRCFHPGLIWNNHLSCVTLKKKKKVTLHLHASIMLCHPVIKRPSHNKVHSRNRKMTKVT